MTPPAHLAASWLLAESFGATRRERRLLTLAGVLPDLDGLGYVVDRISGTTNYYAQFHHVYGHGLVASLLVSVLCASLATQRRVRVGAYAFGIFHVHLVMDLISGKGPDDHIWGISYLFPFYDQQWLWEGTVVLT